VVQGSRTIQLLQAVVAVVAEVLSVYGYLLHRCSPPRHTPSAQVVLHLQLPLETQEEPRYSGCTLKRKEAAVVREASTQLLPWLVVLAEMQA
jgi:hypothetical protein